MRRSFIFLAFVASAAIAACDTATNPRIAQLGPTTGADSVVRLTISPATIQIAVGAQFQLTTNAAPAQVAQVQWATLQGNIAGVSPDGVVTGFAPGSATITARYSFDTTQVASATVNVTGATP